MRPVLFSATVEGAAVRLKIRRDPPHIYDRALSTLTATPEEARRYAAELLQAAEAAEAAAGRAESSEPPP